MKHILFDEAPIVCSPTLADMIGLNRAVFLQQIHYWLQKSEHVRDGKYWIYNSYEKWQEQLFFLSVRTIKRMVDELTSEGILLTAHYSVHGYDRTMWYTIDYDRLEAMLSEHEEKRLQKKKKATQKKDAASGQCMLDFSETDIDEELFADKEKESSEESTAALATSHSDNLAPSIVPSCHDPLCQVDKMHSDKLAPPITENTHNTTTEITAETTHREEGREVQDTSRSPSGRHSPPSDLPPSLADSYPSVYHAFKDGVHEPSKAEEKTLLLLLGQWDELLVHAAILSLAERDERTGTRHRKPVKYISNYLSRLTETEIHGILGQLHKSRAEPEGEVLLNGSTKGSKTDQRRLSNIAGTKGGVHSPTGEKSLLERLTRGMPIYIHDSSQE